MKVAFAVTTVLLTGMGILFLSPRVQVALRMQANAEVNALAQSAALGDVKAVKRLVQFLDNGNGDAIDDLIRISSQLPKSTVETEILPAIGRALKSQNGALRREAALASNDLSEEYICQIVPHLQTMALEDSAQGHPAVQCIARCRRAALPALIAIAGSKSSEPLRGGGADLFTPRVAAVEAIVERGALDAKSVGILEELIDDANPYMRLWAAIGLMDSRHAGRAEGILKDLIVTGDPDMAEFTKETLRFRDNLSPELRELVR